MITDLKVGKCTPVIGPGISDALLGTRQEIAMDWAQSYRFPMAPHNRESLPQVAQYLSVNQGRRFLRSGTAEPPAPHPARAVPR